MLWQWKKRVGGSGLGRGGEFESGRMGGERGGEVDGMEDGRGDGGGVGWKWHPLRRRQRDL